MMVFYTSSTHHLAGQLPYEEGIYLLKKFSDGELYLKLQTNVTHKKVCVVTATNPPAEYLLELFLLLDALMRAHAQIFLIFTYFGYGRQDMPLPQEAATAQMIATFLKIFPLKSIAIIHAHSALLHTYLDFKNIIPQDLICQKAILYDAIVAPDQGAYELVKGLSDSCDVNAIFLSKIRPEHEMVQILKYDGVVRAQKVLIIDDMIATGHTIAEVAKLIAKSGVSTIDVWATHGIFSNNAVELLEGSVIGKVYVTNTLPQHKISAKIEIISIVPLLEQIIASLS